MIKKECIIYEMIEGKITKVEIDNQIYDIRNSNIKLVKEQKPIKEPIKLEQLKDISHISDRNPNTKGEYLGHVSGTGIYTNELKDMKKAIEQQWPKELLENNIIKLYHPNVKDKTINTYCNGYIRYITENETLTPKVTERKKPKKRRKRRRVIPEGAVGFCERYGRYIWRHEYNKVLKGLNYIEYGYKPSVEQISEKFKLSQQIVRAVLNFMMEQEQRVTYKTDGKGTPIYYFVGGKQPC